MSNLALSRGLKVIHHLCRHESARFKDFVSLLEPISNASLMRLLRSLQEMEEIEKSGSQYQLHRFSLLRNALVKNPFYLPVALKEEVREIIRQLSRDTGYSAAIFAWTSSSTMKILASYAPPGSEVRYRPEGHEWPMLPIHPFAQSFLAYAPDFFQEDTFFRWQRYLRAEIRQKNFESFLLELSQIREAGLAHWQGSGPRSGHAVIPVWIHDESIPRFALGIYASDHLESAEKMDLVEKLKNYRTQLKALLSSQIMQGQLETNPLDLQDWEEAINTGSVLS